MTRLFSITLQKFLLWCTQKKFKKQLEIALSKIERDIISWNSVKLETFRDFFKSLIEVMKNAISKKKKIVMY